MCAVALYWFTNVTPSFFAASTLPAGGQRAPAVFTAYGKLLVQLTFCTNPSEAAEQVMQHAVPPAQDSDLDGYWWMTGKQSEVYGKMLWRLAVAYHWHIIMEKMTSVNYDTVILPDLLAGLPYAVHCFTKAGQLQDGGCIMIMHLKLEGTMGWLVLVQAPGMVPAGQVSSWAGKMYAAGDARPTAAAHNVVVVEEGWQVGKAAGQLFLSGPSSEELLARGEVHTVYFVFKCDTVEGVRKMTDLAGPYIVSQMLTPGRETRQPVTASWEQRDAAAEERTRRLADIKKVTGLESQRMVELSRLLPTSEPLIDVEVECLQHVLQYAGKHPAQLLRSATPATAPGAGAGAAPGAPAAGENSNRLPLARCIAAVSKPYGTCCCD
jgi:hypothetical protein